jgi:hypothetical protein
VLVFLRYITVRMVRDERDMVEKVLFSGKEAGLSFEKLDEKMQSWGRKTFGDKYAKDLWRNELLELSTINIKEDKLHKFAFEMHVRKFTTCCVKTM